VKKKKLLLTSAALAVSIAAGSANATDIPAWTGFYVGVNLGYSFGDWSASSNQRIYNFEQFTANLKSMALLAACRPAITGG
jgi:opacity protein-like surface antigen